MNVKPPTPSEHDEIVRHLALYEIPAHALVCELRHPAGDVFRATASRAVAVRESPTATDGGDPCSEFYAILRGGSVVRFPVDWYVRGVESDGHAHLVLRESIGIAYGVAAESAEERRVTASHTTSANALTNRARDAHRFVCRALARISRTAATAWFSTIDRGPKRRDSK